MINEEWFENERKMRLPDGNTDDIFKAHYENYCTELFIYSSIIIKLTSNWNVCK